MFFFFNDTATTEIYTLSLHDALPISIASRARRTSCRRSGSSPTRPRCSAWRRGYGRSEEHTSELQSHLNLVCRLLLEKKKHHCRQEGGKYLGGNTADHAGAVGDSAAR